MLTKVHGWGWGSSEIHCKVHKCYSKGDEKKRQNDRWKYFNINKQQSVNISNKALLQIIKKQNRNKATEKINGFYEKAFYRTYGGDRIGK